MFCHRFPYFSPFLAPQLVHTGATVQSSLKVLHYGVTIFLFLSMQYPKFNNIQLQSHCLINGSLFKILGTVAKKCNNNNNNPNFIFQEVDDQRSKELNPNACRAELRERFLWAMTSLVGQQATVSMQDDITVKGVFRGMDKDILRIHMQDLHTPAAVQPWATIRLPDCFSLTFKI